jgi:hypothetical protein
MLENGIQPDDTWQGMLGVQACCNAMELEYHQVKKTVSWNVPDMLKFQKFIEYHDDIYIYIYLYHYIYNLFNCMDCISMESLSRHLE